MSSIIITKNNKVESILDAMDLFRECHKKIEFYYINSLNKAIKLMMVRNNIVFDEIKYYNLIDN